MGTIVGYPLAGFLADTDVGWPLIFYVTGGMGLVWSFAFWWICASNPSTHKYISREERQYIETSIQVDTAKEETVSVSAGRRG